MVNRSRIMLNLNNPDNQKLIVMELDSALNTFLDKIPAQCVREPPQTSPQTRLSDSSSLIDLFHSLRWNTTGSNDLFFQQSVLLYSWSVVLSPDRLFLLSDLSGAHITSVAST